MIEVIGIRFKDGGKIYYFAPSGITFEENQYAIVETVRGVEMGKVVITNRHIPEESVVSPLKPVIRCATGEDLKVAEQNKVKEKEAFTICETKIRDHGLKMNLVDVEYTFDGSKILFYFTADGRVDFRELVKDLAAVFRTRIELRQIGVRDEAKLLGGIGICGHPFCCKTFLGDFQPVSIKMAKEQSLSLNPTKISGTCGRLMCCLKYEQDVYEEYLKQVPKVDAIVDTPEGKGVVVDVNVLARKIGVKLDNPDIQAVKTFSASDVVIIKDAVVKLTREEIRALKELEDK